jgi:WD40 repeat protein
VFKNGLPDVLLSIPGPKQALAGQPVFFPDGRRLAFVAGNNVHVWDIRSQRQVAILKGHRNSIGAIAVSPDGARIVTGGSDDTFRIWDADRYAHLLTFRISEANGICCLSFSSDSLCIAAGTGSGQLYLWSVGPHGVL